MKHILLITGREAAPSLAEMTKDGRIHVCRIDVAALLSTDMISRELSKLDLSDISMIIVPGSVRGDVSVIGKRLRIPCYKGPRHLADLPSILDDIENIRLSTIKPADDVIEIDTNKKANRLLKKTFNMKGKLKIKNLNIGNIPHIIAEIPDAPILKDQERVKKARYFLKSGASIIDIGMISGEENADKIQDIVNSLKTIKAPISIDTLNEKEILKAVDCGVDLVLSIDEKNKEIVGSIKKPVVVIPRDKKGRVPSNPDERVRLLEKLVSYVKDYCFPIADPLLGPIHHGFVDSVYTYRLFRDRNPGEAMMMGAGNVTEMIDADSLGINAILAGIASELNIDLIFTTEASDKTIGTVAELSKAVGMMYLSKTREQSPKDIGFDLLYMKEKKKTEPIIDSKTRKIKVVKAKKRKISLEGSSFRIYIKDDEIVAVHYLSERPTIAFKGTKAEELYSEILSRIPLNETHSAYLGKELAKAEIALRLRKNYVQDEDLFKTNLRDYPKW